MAGTAAIPAILEEARREHVFPGYAVWAEANDHAYEWYGGVTSDWPGGVPVTAATFFDIGSITKVVASTSIAARYFDAGRLRLEDTVGRHLPELVGTGFAGLQLGELLAHAGGLLGWYPLFRDRVTLATFPLWLCAHEKEILVGKPRGKAVYSDLGMLLFGLVLDRVALPQGGFRAAFRTEVVEPLELTEVQFGPISGVAVAATEFCLWRNRVLQGEVFDENCSALGGTAAHAGLFATARGIAKWAREWARATRGKSEWIRPQTALLFTRPSRLGPALATSTWAYGWDTKSKEGSGAGTRFSDDSFGHYGYPGCSVWIDPAREGFVLFFTNRIHPSRVDERIKRVRPILHDAIAQMWDTVRR